MVSCGGAKNKKREIKDVAVEHYEPGTRQVDIDFNIYSYTSKEEFDEAIHRYWDGFDFECGERVVEYDTVSVMQAFADFGTPMLIGEGYQTFPVMIYNAYLGEGGTNRNFAAALAVVAIVITAIVFFFQKIQMTYCFINHFS